VPARKDNLVWAAIAACTAELAFQWARVWSLFPELRWGWAVPFLVAWMARERWLDRPPRSPVFPSGLLLALSFFVLAILLAAFPFLRLLIEPFPAWPTVAWLLSGTLIALILILVAASQGWARARHFLFPLAFGVTALPWPTFLAVAAMGRLRVLLAGLVAEVIDLAGKPAYATGTVIRVGAGSVGIEEACGGIRSMQAAVMLALALGELRRLPWRSRILCVAAGIGLGILGNTLRMGILTSICAYRGQESIHAWHDTLGAGEMVFVFGGLSWFVLRLKGPPSGSGLPPGSSSAAGAGAGERPSEPRLQVSPSGPSSAVPLGAAPSRWLPTLAGAILAVVVFGEVATQAWYWRGDVLGRQATPWTAQLPRGLPSYKEIPFTESMQSMLSCDSHQIGQWKDAAGNDRAGYVIGWENGQVAEFAVLHHNPDICLTLGGSLIVQANPPVRVRVGNSELPFSSRIYLSGGKRYYVYFLAWNLSAGVPLPTDAGESGIPTPWFQRQWREVAAARRSLRARIIAVAIYHSPSPSEAEASFREEIGHILK
jgi:exosortase